MRRTGPEGGSLVSAGVAVALLAYGWHRGRAWVWWSLATGAGARFGATMAIYLGVRYTDFWDLAPVYAGSILNILSLGLSYPYLLDRWPLTVRPVTAALAKS